MAVIDGLGNMNVQLPGIFSGRKGQRGRPQHHAAHPPVKLTGKAGVAAQALLLARKGGGESTIWRMKPEYLWGWHIASWTGSSAKTWLLPKVRDRNVFAG